VARRNSQRCEIRLCQAGIVIERSASNRVVVFGAAGALKITSRHDGGDGMRPPPI
jgi:hypothetical protein